MIKIVFVCHGNICRSPMAEFIFKKIVKEHNLENQFLIQSRATSEEAIGEDIDSRVQNIFKIHNINFEHREARRITKIDYDNFDYIFVMDTRNVRNLKMIFPDPQNKIHTLFGFFTEEKNVEDPWYHHNFELTFQEINYCCSEIFKILVQKHQLERE